MKDLVSFFEQVFFDKCFMVIQNRLLPEVLSKFVLFLGTFVHLCWQAEKTTFVGGVAVAPSLFFVFGFLGLFFCAFQVLGVAAPKCVNGVYLGEVWQRCEEGI